MSKDEVGTQHWSVFYLPLETIFLPDLFWSEFWSALFYFILWFIWKWYLSSLFILCKYFLWKQLLFVVAPTAVAVNEKQTESVCFLVSATKSEDAQKCFYSNWHVRSYFFFPFLDLKCYFHFHFSAWVRRRVVRRWAMVEQGWPLGKITISVPMLPKRIFKLTVIVGKQRYEIQKILELPKSWVLLMVWYCSTSG